MVSDRPTTAEQEEVSRLLDSISRTLIELKDRYVPSHCLYAQEVMKLRLDDIAKFQAKEPAKTLAAAVLSKQQTTETPA